MFIRQATKTPLLEGERCNWKVNYFCFNKTFGVFTLSHTLPAQLTSTTLVIAGLDICIKRGEFKCLMVAYHFDGSEIHE